MPKYYGAYTITEDGDITYDAVNIDENIWLENKDRYDGTFDKHDNSWWVYVCVDEDEL